MDFLQVDVFAERAYGGNPLAVYPDAAELSTDQMQAIAAEMNLSETTFVVQSSERSYDVRIFTPKTELSFAGHPTIGTAWTLKHLGLLSEDQVVQRSAAGETAVTVTGDRASFRRSGQAERDLEEEDPRVIRTLADALGIMQEDVGLEARELGRSGRLRPSYSDGGLRQLMVPVRSIDVLESCAVRSDLLARIDDMGAYVFTAAQAGRVRARGFFPGAGVPEDPATGSAAAALGIYLADRLGEIDLEISQGREIGRPSRIHVSARNEAVTVAGDTVLIFHGTLDQLPES